MRYVGEWLLMFVLFGGCAVLSVVAYGLISFLRHAGEEETEE